MSGGPRIGMAALALALAACSGGEQTVCGSGTLLTGQECLPAADALTCGAGTVAVGGICVAGDISGGDDASPLEVTGPDGGGPDSGAPDDATHDLDATDADEPELPCSPSCVEKECGSDGCGGSCGQCTTAQYPVCETALGVCVPTCVPACLGKTCGSDGCGGTCGSCAPTATCRDLGRCVPDAWTCDATWYAAFDPCDCECGAADPDCADPSNYVSGCKSQEICDAQGQCVSKVPAGWTCSPLSYAAVDGCDCECGVVDPDCKLIGLPIVGCPWGATCTPEGTCAACVPDCDGRECGDDGCGGSCGACGTEPLLACAEGHCVDPCSPTPILCETNVCGEDGCGGSCGACPAGAECTNGACHTLVVPPSPTSCVGRCGGYAPSGCACVPGCEGDGSCCGDFAPVCACQPDCNGKACGSDGCGGTCGTCGSAVPYCSSQQQCTATCAPQCTGKACGADGCGGTCGTCGAGEACEWTWQCVPSAWACPVAYYADGQACDCGCGVGDPDCTDDQLPLFGCPASATACNVGGACEAAFCSKDSSCTGGAWCSGVYAAGDGRFRGVCASPDASAHPPGFSCDVDAECSTNTCVGGLCRTYCEADADCPGGQRCVGAAVTSDSTGAVLGFASVCDAIDGSGAPCAAQKDCAPKGEVCTAYVGLTPSFGPRYLCAGGVASGGASCAVSDCPLGQLCAPAASGAVCGLACPGGAADCPSGAICGTMAFHNHGTPAPADDPTVPVCLPN